MSLFDDKYEILEEKLPTLKQYLKAMGKKKIPNQFFVTKIWIPNKYPSFSIETEKFRASVGKNTPLGKALIDNWDELLELEKGLNLGVEIVEKGANKFSLSEGSVPGMWRDIGEDKPLGFYWERD